jgi:predicted deacylase
MTSPHIPTDLKPYPLEIAPPDISLYRSGNTDVEYFTTYTGPVAGPHIMITALTHGNELCGAVVLDALFKSEFRPLRGRLTLGFCNVEAFHSFNRDYPTLSRFVDEDMNRLWEIPVLNSARDTVEARRCREIRPLLDQVDFLLDIHSMQRPTPALMLAGSMPKGRALAEAVGVPESVVIDHGHAAGRRMRDYDRFSDPMTHHAALLVECGQHWSKISVEVARQTMIRFLVATGCADQGLIEDWLEPEPPPTQQVIEVIDPITVKNDIFTFVAPYIGMEVIAKAGTLLAMDGDTAIHTAHDNCVLIMPSHRLSRGQTAVRLGRFVD